MWLKLPSRYDLEVSCYYHDHVIQYECRQNIQAAAIILYT